MLDERVPFLKSPVLRPDQEEDYNLPAVSEQVGHRLRALRPRPRARATGSGRTACRLMGTGDWNDGMNQVGAHGKGESVWTAGSSSPC